MTDEEILDSRGKIVPCGRRERERESVCVRERVRERETLGPDKEYCVCKLDVGVF